MVRKIVRVNAQGSTSGMIPALMFIENLQKDPPFFFAVVITVVLSICIHELAHGVVAIWRGDRTPIRPCS